MDGKNKRNNKKKGFLFCEEIFDMDWYNDSNFFIDSKTGILGEF